MKLLDGVQQFYQLDQQFGLLLERIQRFEQEYNADTVPHATIELLVKELGGYLSMVDQEILSAQSKREQASKLDNPLLVAESDLLIQRLTLTRNSLAHYADRLAALPIYGQEVFVNSYQSLAEISADEELTMKTKALVDEYIENKTKIPFTIDLDNKIESKMEEHEHSIQLHNTYLLSINNMLDMVQNQLNHIEQLTQGIFGVLKTQYHSNWDKSYTIDSLDLSKTKFYTDYQAFLDHTNELIEGLLQLDTIKDKLECMISCPFGQGKQYQSDFVDCLKKKSFDDIIRSCKQFVKTIQLDYLVSLYTQCNLLRSATYQGKPIGQDLVKQAVKQTDQHERLDLIKSILSEYDQLVTLSSLDTSIPQGPGARDQFDVRLQDLITDFLQALDSAWQQLISHIQSQKLFKSDFNKLQAQANDLIEVLEVLRQALALVSQADELMKTFEQQQDLGYNSPIVKKEIRQQRSKLRTQFVNAHQAIHELSLDEHLKTDLNETIKIYTKTILSMIKKMNQIGDEVQVFRQDVSSIGSSISKANDYSYSARDSLSTVKKTFSPTLSHPLLQALLPQIDAYIAQQYTQAYQSYQSRPSVSTSSSSSGWSSGSSRSSGSSSSSWSSSSSSFGSSGDSFSSSGGTSW